MPKANSAASDRAKAPCGWSNRVLSLALAGIFFLTFYPFRFTLHSRPLAHASPFLLGGVWKMAPPLDILLNILLFVPFGFGITEKLRERRWTCGATFIAAWIAGFLLSYSIEFTQQFTPTRASRWEDVVTNSTGAILGFLLFELCGGLIVPAASNAERSLRGALTLRRAAVLVPVYFGLWFILTAVLQRETRLSNWDSGAQLMLGADAGTYPPTAWKGSISRLQVWDRALPDDLARSMSSGESSSGAESDLVASYDFLAAQPLRDRVQQSPDLSWIPRAPSELAQNGAAFDGSSWLASSVPATNLVGGLRKTNQFTIEVACTPADSDHVNGDLVAISPSEGTYDLYVRQHDSKLEIWLRNPITAGNARLDWAIPDAFAAGQRHDILVSYDGSFANVYIDGKKHRGDYELGAGAALDELIHRAKTPELKGYAFIYNALIFLSAGTLLGLVAGSAARRKPVIVLIMAFEFACAPLLLDRILAAGSGRPISFSSIATSLILLAAGSAWINLDRRRGAAAGA
jgi:glycopeptide antibiotics resistance protein